MTPNRPDVESLETTRWWRALRRLLPPHFRRHWSRELLAAHVDWLRRRTTLGVGAMLGFWLRLGADVTRTAVGARLDARRGGRTGTAGRLSTWFDLRWHVRLAVRSLVRHPRFSLGVIGILVAGIGANLTIFTVLDRLLVSPPPHVRNADELRRLHSFGSTPFTGNEPGLVSAFSYPDFEALASAAGVEGLAGVGRRSLTTDAAGTPTTVRVEAATASYFPLLGVEPALGRFFEPAEDRVGATAPAAVLSYDYWSSRFGADPSALGRSIDVGRGGYRIVGVAPRHFTGIDLDPVDLWLPLRTSMAVESGDAWVRSSRWAIMEIVARVSDPVSAAQSATTSSRAGRTSLSWADPDATIILSNIRAARGPEPPPEVLVAQFLGALTLLVLLISAANVGNLVLARATARRRERAVHAALGAGRARMAVHGLLEVGILTAIAAAGSLWLALSAGSVLYRLLMPESTGVVRPSSSIVLAAAGLAVAAATMACLAPAVRDARTDLMEALRDRTAGTGPRSLRPGLLVVQCAFSVVILLAAGLFVRSARSAAAVDLGIDLDAVAVDVESASGESFGDEVAAIVAESLERVRGLPGVEAAASVTLPPLSGRWGISLAVPGGEPLVSRPDGPFVYGVSGSYFAVVGTSILRGRPLDDRDAVPGAPPVAVVGEALAHTLWPDADPLDQCLHAGTATQDGVGCTTVVGIAEDYRSSVRSVSPGLLLYLPTGHPGVGSAGDLLLTLRDGVDPAEVARALTRLSPDVRLATARRLSSLAEPQLRSWRLGATLLQAFGVLALLVTAAGLYSSLTFDITQRRRELGIRVALGAHAGMLFRGTVLAQLRMVALGVAAGLALGLPIAFRAEDLLFRTGPADPLALLGASLLLLAVAASAVALPARAATRTDPSVVLRGE